jgi:hypothetical protein
MQKHRVRRNLHVIARMLRSVTRRTLENKIGGQWFTIEEAPERRTNGKLVTYKEKKAKDIRGDIFFLEEGGKSKAKHVLRYENETEGITCFCKELGEGRPLFEGRTWTEVYKKMETYALWQRNQQPQT